MKIGAIYARHEGRYGQRRVISLALRQAGAMVNHRTLQSLMRALGLKSLAQSFGLDASPPCQADKADRNSERGFTEECATPAEPRTA